MGAGVLGLIGILMLGGFIADHVRKEMKLMTVNINEKSKIALNTKNYKVVKTMPKKN